MPKGIQGFQKGVKLSEEHRKNIGLGKKGIKPKNWESLYTPEMNRKRSLSLKGKKKSEKHRKNMRGHSISTETRKKMSEAQKGEKNSSWLGGTSFKLYSVDWTKELKMSIRKRDNYICHICNQYGKHVHHINYNKKDCNYNNLITLCLKCHNKTNFNRKNWIGYFNKSRKQK